jgi:hypothetical protein
VNIVDFTSNTKSSKRTKGQTDEQTNEQIFIMQRNVLQEIIKVQRTIREMEEEGNNETKR